MLAVRFAPSRTVGYPEVCEMITADEEAQIMRESVRQRSPTMVSVIAFVCTLVLSIISMFDSGNGQPAKPRPPKSYEINVEKLCA